MPEDNKPLQGAMFFAKAVEEIKTILGEYPNLESEFRFPYDNAIDALARNDIHGVFFWCGTVYNILRYLHSASNNEIFKARAGNIMRHLHIRIAKNAPGTGGLS